MTHEAAKESIGSYFRLLPHYTKENSAAAFFKEFFN